MENAQIAEMFDEIADLLDLQEGNPFRIRAYRNVARTVRDLSHRLEDMVAEGKDLTDLPQVGEATAAKIVEMVNTGTCKRLEELRKEVPPELTRLMDVPRLGPQKAMLIFKELGVKTLADLRKACEEHRVRDLPGMGEKSEQNVLEGLKTLESVAGRILISEAQENVESLGGHLDRIPSVRRWALAGSYRRRRETIGNLDILLHAEDRGRAAEAILEYKMIRDVIGRGEERLSVVLDTGLQVDFRFFEPESFGAALLYFTGSKAHNIALRKLAQKRGWKLSEYGLFQGEKRLAGGDEESVYKRLNLPWIPPELREDRGELEAAEQDALPQLIELGDIRGDLQCHTTASDGAASIEDMARAARDKGYQYLAVTDHSKAVTVAGGLDEEALRRHADHIREVDASLKDIWVMAGVEVDVLKDGRLDLDEKLLAELDWVVASIHYHLNLDEKRMTDRLVSAVKSGVVHCLGHPLDRLIGKRDPLPLDMARIIEACRDNGVRLEINAQPDRLDLPDTHCREARQAGVGFTLGTDAHATAGLDLMPFGVDVARRGWLEKPDVLNACTVGQLRKKIGRG